MKAAHIQHARRTQRRAFSCNRLVASAPAQIKHSDRRSDETVHTSLITRNPMQTAALSPQHQNHGGLLLHMDWTYTRLIGLTDGEFLALWIRTFGGMPAILLTRPEMAEVFMMFTDSPAEDEVRQMRCA